MIADTSAAALASIAKDRQAMIEKIMGHINSQGSHGSTCDEAEIATGFSHQTTSGRFRDLALATRIMDLGERRPTRSGRKAKVWFSAEPTK